VLAQQQSDKAREARSCSTLLPAPDEKLRDGLLVDNPAELYGLPKS
jgi:hypothetical protein